MILCKTAVDSTLTGTGLDLTPVIDMVFLLLIYSSRQPPFNAANAR